MNVKAIEEIKKREASIINCEGEEKLREVVAKIWDVNSDLIPVGAKYYTNSIDLRSVFETSSYNQTPKEYKPSEILGGGRTNRIDPNIQMQINALENAISRAQETIENLKNLK